MVITKTILQVEKTKLYTFYFMFEEVIYLCEFNNIIDYTNIYNR